MKPDWNGLRVGNLLICPNVDLRKFYLIHRINIGQDIIVYETIILPEMTKTIFHIFRGDYSRFGFYKLEDYLKLKAIYEQIKTEFIKSDMFFP